MEKISRLAGIAVLLIIFFLLAGCPAKSPINKAEADLPAIAAIAVLPAQVAVDNSAPDALAASRLEAGAQVLSSLTADYFKNRPDVRIIDQSQQEGLAPEAALNRVALARRIGEQVGSDAVLLSTMHRYLPRKGAEAQAASVAFDYKLVEVATGRILCIATFDETQQPLFENIFAFGRAVKRGFKWITAEELAKEGLLQKFESCPYLKGPGLAPQPAR